MEMNSLVEFFIVVGVMASIVLAWSVYDNWRDHQENLKEKI